MSGQSSTDALRTKLSDESLSKKKSAKRRKVNHACLYCRRSHMTCDDNRPCARCVKRGIGERCHDEQKSKPNEKISTRSSVELESVVPEPTYAPPPDHPPTIPWPIQNQFGYRSETLGNEFAVLTDFLETLGNDDALLNPTVEPSLMTASTIDLQSMTSNPPLPSNLIKPELSTDISLQEPATPLPVVIPAATKTERFLLTAADQESGSRDQRLKRVIQSKYEAGLLKPHNYVKGYARLSRWMDQNVSQASKQQILQPLSILRPKFRAVAQSLRDIDLVFIEEAFERMLLDYDRVFSAMGVPACLWRRTGEIYKGNREFTELLGLDGYLMRDGRLCIYELMSEESAVNYWEKYGAVAFDSDQKTVLTTCQFKKHFGNVTGVGETLIDACMSFTIRRDRWGIPSVIVGNFIKC